MAEGLTDSGWTLSIHPSVGTETNNFDLRGISEIRPCLEGGPWGLLLAAAPGALIEVPVLPLDFTGWEGAAVSITVPQWGASGIFDWVACAFSGTAQTPIYRILGIGDGADIFEASYDESGHHGGAGIRLLLPAPFTVPLLEVSISGDFHGLRFSIIHSVRRWTPDTDPPDPPVIVDPPEFTPQPPPLPLCGGVPESAPVIGTQKSGVVRGG